jgi:hypothetical protein
MGLRNNGRLTDSPARTNLALLFIAPCAFTRYERRLIAWLYYSLDHQRREEQAWFL